MTFEVDGELGQYRVEDRLGLGGMGIVMLGRHMLLNRPVAMKIRERTRRSDDSLLGERFRQGAMLQGELRHPHIGRILDYLETDEYQVIIMELLDGGTVEQWLNQSGGPLPVGSTIEIGIRVCRALQYAHSCGVIHRDLKPSNLILESAGKADTVCVTDFGVAKAPDRSPDLTVAGANVGTLWYMSPEQLSHEDATPQADIYSLGATLYELLTGHVPFEVAETPYVFRRFLDGDPLPPIRSRNETIPPHLATLVEAALELDVERRVKTARFFAWALYNCAVREKIWLPQVLSDTYTANELASFRAELARLPVELASFLEAALPDREQLEATEVLALSGIIAPVQTLDESQTSRVPRSWPPQSEESDELSFDDEDGPTGIVEMPPADFFDQRAGDDEHVLTEALSCVEDETDDDDGDQTLISVVVYNDDD